MQELEQAARWRRRSLAQPSAGIEAFTKVEFLIVNPGDPAPIITEMEGEPQIKKDTYIEPGKHVEIRHHETVEVACADASVAQIQLVDPGKRKDEAVIARMLMPLLQVHELKGLRPLKAVPDRAAIDAARERARRLGGNQIVDRRIELPLQRDINV